MHLGAGGEEEGAHGSCQSDADGADVRANVSHRVKHRHACTHNHPQGSDWTDPHIVCNLCLVRIIYFLFVLHCPLMTQLAHQPDFGWNSCNILYFCNICLTKTETTLRAQLKQVAWDITRDPCSARICSLLSRRTLCAWHIWLPRLPSCRVSTCLSTGEARLLTGDGPRPTP